MYAEIVHPLYKLLNEFEWTEESQNSYDAFKKALVATPILRGPNWDLVFHVILMPQNLLSVPRYLNMVLIMFFTLAASCPKPYYLRNNDMIQETTSLKPLLKPSNNGAHFYLVAPGLLLYVPITKI